MQCPCCGQKVDKTTFLIDINTNTVSFKDQSLKLPPQLAVLLYALNEARPKTVSDHDLNYAAWGMHPPDSAYRAIAAQIHDLKLILLGWNVKILRVTKRGYRLVLPNA